ncbi:ATP-binding protein [Agrobacterium radiobacter]|uniref:ATP-binding protein n=1 Tax=Agrobacterium radiobacter TaxID=362 RepID=UPI003F82C3D4
MTKILPIICKNNLTGEISEFGVGENDALRTLLLKCMEHTKNDEKEGLYFERFDEFSFSAHNKISFVDTEGKKRNLVFSKEEISSYCGDLVTFLRSQTQDFIDYTHDIQYLIGALNALSVQKKSEEDDLKAYKEKLGNINLLSIIISAKSTYFRFMTEDIERMDIDNVSIKGKTFKIFKGVDFLARTKRRNVTARFESSCDLTARMPDIFEFIPYSIVENAIKYGLKDMDLDFEVKDTRTDILVEIGSMGPQILAHERELIFERGYRGETVRERSRFAGHGLGLFQAKRAAKILFGGTITVQQNAPTVTLDGIAYGYTTFTIHVPKSGAK